MWEVIRFNQLPSVAIRFNQVQSAHLPEERPPDEGGNQPLQSGAIRCNLPISPRSAYPLLNRGAMVQS